MSQNTSNEPAEILELFDKRPTVIKPGLTRIRAALDCLGLPAIGIPRIVVAGTNGKGTTSGMIWRILSAAGFKVGLFTSPHLVEFRERISISGTDVTNQRLVELIREIKRRLPHELWAELTFFEINTLLAFMVFQIEKTDVNVLEVGLGGRLDCVNVYDPDVAVITSIGMDHMEYLGSSLEAIAGEKAGIMRKSRPVIWCAEGWSDAQADTAITLAAKEIGAKLLRADDVMIKALPRSLQTRPFFIQRNFQLAKLAITEFFAVTNLSAKRSHFTEDFTELYDSPRAPWPVTFTGRFDLLTLCKEDRSVKVLLDVCHNPHGASALSRALQNSKVIGANGKLNCLFSVLADKDAAGIWMVLKGNIGEVIPFRSSSVRSWASLPEQMHGAGVEEMLGSFDAAWNQALNKESWRRQMPWLICGSVAMVGEVLAYWQKHGWQLDRVQDS